MHSASHSDADNEIRNLHDALDYIFSLEQEIDRNASNTNKELEICNDELIQCKDEIAELQLQLKQLRGDNDTLVEEKTQLENQLSLQKSLLDQRSSQDKNKNVMRHQRDVHMLELENQRLRASVIEMERNEDVLVNEIDTLVLEKSKYQDKSDELSAKVDSLSAKNDEMRRHLADVKQDNNNLLRKEKAAMQQISKLATELENERSKAHHLDLAAMKKENECLRASHDLCVADKHAAERDLDHLIQALHQAKCNEKEAIAAAVRKERAGVVKAQMDIDGLKQRESDLTQQCDDLVRKLETIQKQLDKAKEKNSLYEKGHGLENAIRYQTKLEADIRRRDFDLKKMEENYCIQKDKCLVLTKACDILKQKANLGPDFLFDEEEINVVLKCEENALKSENSELLRQLQWLEGERNDLLSQLRQQAVEIGEKGVKFLGMESSQVALVIEFANNLRQGIVELPPTDRSAELLSQLSSIKAEREVDKVTIERLERELFALSETRRDHIEDGEKKILLHALDAMKVEMKALQGDGSSAMSPMIKKRAKEIIGEDLVLMPAAAEVQFVCLMKEYDSVLEKLANSAIKAEDNKCLEFNYAQLLDQSHSCDTPNKELFRQLLLSGQENRELKKKLRHSEADAKAMRALLEKDRDRLQVGAASSGPRIDDDAIGDGINKVHLEMKQMMIALESNLEPLTGYSRDLFRLRNAVVKSSRLPAQLSALHDLLETKNRIIKDMRRKLALAKQKNQTLTRELYIGRDVDRSISTHSLDRSGVLSTPGSSLEDAAKLLFEKDHTINSLSSKLVAEEKSQGILLQEADRMKADIQTLVARLEEAEGVACEIEVYKSSCIELKNAVDDGKKDIAGLKEKLRRVSKDAKEKEAKIDELKESLIRAKRVLSVQRQGRSRSEHNLRTSTDTITSLKEQIEKMETQRDRARDEKLKANNKVRRLSSMLQTAARSTSDNNINEEAAKISAEEKQKRIDVQNNTIKGLASQNSKLRSELARVKMAAKKDADKEKECAQCKNFESKVTSLEQSLSREKKDLLTTQSKLERCKKNAHSLEQQIAHLMADLEKKCAAEAKDVANDYLQAEISALREKNESLLLAMKDNNFDTLKLLRAENFQLRKENERLLKVDHLGLIERVEEMTYRYNVAVMQLNQLSMR